MLNPSSSSSSSSSFYLLPTKTCLRTFQFRNARFKPIPLLQHPPPSLLDKLVKPRRELRHARLQRLEPEIHRRQCICHSQWRRLFQRRAGAIAAAPARVLRPGVRRG